MTSNEPFRDLTCPSCGVDFSWTKRDGSGLQVSYEAVSRICKAHLTHCPVQLELANLILARLRSSKSFLYQTMRLPEQWLSFKGVRRLSVNREVLEKLDQYLYARPFINTILAIRDLGKQLEIFESAIDPDGRFRAAYNIAGTETGRPSSSEKCIRNWSKCSKHCSKSTIRFLCRPRIPTSRR